MDILISRLPARQDADLMICEAHGVAYQADMTSRRVEYGIDYLAKVEGYEDTPIARAVNAGRCAMLARNLPAGASVLDIGAGTGAFVRAARASGFDAKGYDINRTAQARLWAAGLDGKDPAEFDAVTMWDAIEHCEEPAIYLDAIRQGAYLFVSLPVFEDLDRIRESRHYRPGEHLYYFNRIGFIAWLTYYRFSFVEASNHEVTAGRESIAAFASRRDLPIEVAA